jgi:hypothetical protein
MNIYFLKETHCNNETELKFQSDWGDKCIFSNKISQSAGVMIYWGIFVSTNIFFSIGLRILQMSIKSFLSMNVHWMFLYNLKVFCSDMKFKMAATAGLSLT